MILVTGSTGTVGSAVLNALLAAGVPVRASYLSPEKARQAPKGATPVILDFARTETLGPALTGIDTLFLVGPPVQNLPLLEANAIDAATKAGVKRIVKLSAIGADGRESTFPSQHRDGEECIERSGMAWTFLRPNGFFQNMVNYNGSSIKSQGTFYAAMQDAKVSYVDVRDVGAVAAKVLTSSGHEGKAYDITGPEALSNADMAEILSRVVGRKIQYVDLPAAALKQGMVGAGIPEWSADALLDLQRYYTTGRAATVTNTVQKVTGKAPRSFEQYVRESVERFQ